MHRLKKHNNKKSSENASPECRANIFPLSAMLYDAAKCVKRKKRKHYCQERP